MPRLQGRAPGFMRGIGALSGIAALALSGCSATASAGKSPGGPAMSGLPTSVPSCPWPLRVRGKQGPATAEQAGLARCYLRALARHDAAGLQAVADTTSGRVRFTKADFAHAADARAGTATVKFRPNPDDSASLEVVIVFADGARDSEAVTIANPSSQHSWRLEIGTPVSAPKGPPSAQPGPLTSSPS